MEPTGSLLHRKSSTVPPHPPPPLPSIVASRSALSFSSSSSSGEMEDLPFSLEDLPPEIRNKIDDIIDKNEDLESQLEAIDELLFADRLFAKLEGGARYDIGSESGIGSDSDSGNGITPSTDPLRNTSTASSTFFRPAGESAAVIDPRTFGPLPLRSTPLRPERDVDYLIGRLVVPAPPRSSSPSKFSVQHETPRSHRSSPAPASLSPMVVGYQNGFQSKPPAIKNGDGVSSAPLGLGVVLASESPRDTKIYDSKDEPVRIVASRATGDASLGSLDARQDSRSTPSSDPSQERNSRTPATKWEGKNNSGPAASRILKNNRISTNVATELSSLQSNTRQNIPPLSRSSSRTELYAWSDVPGLPTSSQPVVRSSKPINSEKSVSAIDSGAIRGSQPSLETSRKSKLFLRKDETDSVSVGGWNISGQRRDPKGLNGSTFDLRRNKWSSVFEISSQGNSGRDDISDDEGSDFENIDDVKKGVASVEDDNFSNLVRLREKNGKPSQMVRINHRTLKAQSMLSLYDPSSDAKEKATVKKSNRKEAGGVSDSRKRLSTFLQRKLKFYKKSNEGTTARQSYERTDLTNGVISKVDSEAELHRSDYLGPNVSSVPVRRSIPSPSLYASLETKNGNNLKMRSRSEGPGHISEIFRVDSRDLNVDDDRPRLTFDTFRGQIEPIRWRDEKTNISGANRRNNASVTANEPSFVSSEPQSLVPSLAVNMSASNGNNPIHLSTNINSLHRPNDHSNSRSERFDEKQSTNNREQFDNNSVRSVPPPATLPVIKPAMHPTSKPLRIQGNAAGRFTASRASASPQATRTNVVSSRIIADGLGDSADQRSVPSSDPRSRLSNTNYNPKDVQSFGRQRENSTHHTTTTTTTDVVFSASNTLPNNERTQNNGNDDHRSYSEEQTVLLTSYDDAASACDRAVLDARRTLSGLLADRERILSASSSTSGSGTALYRTRKELLLSNCRQLVTDVKLMVAGATRSRPDMIDALTAVMHTFARVFEACRLTAETLPTPDGRSWRRRTLLDEVLKLGDVFLDTLSSGSVAAGRGQDDPAMVLLMYHTTEMAHSLGRLLSTIKSLDE